MNNHNFTTTFTVDQTPEEAFDAINNVRGWWSQEIEGSTDKLGAVFYYHYQDVRRCTFKITELVPGKQVVWRVLHNYFNFVKDKSEWNGTDVIFEITRKGDKTELRFTHAGLEPAYECYDVCSDAWGRYITRSLRDLITSGKGQPNPTTMAPLHEQTWESFSKNWNTDVRSTFHWIQGALRLPLERGSRVLMSSSGAAIEGSPLSGGYAGAKRMIWMMAGYANGLASDLSLGIRFQALLVRQIVGATELGRAAAEAYARRKGVSAEAFLAGFGKPLSPRDFGEHVVTLLTDPKYESATAFGIRGETGVELLKA